MREHGDETLALRSKQSLGFEHGFQPHKFLIECAFPHRTDLIDVELVLAADFVDPNLAMHFHGFPILQWNPQSGRARLPHDAPEGSGRIFQGEVHMTRGRSRQVRDLPLYPDVLKDFILLQEPADEERQFGNSPLLCGEKCGLH